MSCMARLSSETSPSTVFPSLLIEMWVYCPKLGKRSTKRVRSKLGPNPKSKLRESFNGIG